MTRHSLHRWLHRPTIIVLMAITLLWTSFPIAFTILGSFKPARNLFDYPPRLLDQYNLDNYRTLWNNNPEYVTHFLLNSVISTVACVLVTLAIAFSAAYVFSRFRCRWLKYPAYLIITIRMFPPIVLTIPLYPVFNSLGLIDTITAIVLAGAALLVSIVMLLLKTFMDDIPRELEEAAMIDGCTRFGAFLRITLPLMAPGIAAVSLFVAIAMWNEFLLPLVFASSNARTAPVAIAVALGHTDGVAWGPLLAMSTIHLAPMLLLVMVLHKHLVRGMTLGAVKG